MNYYRHFRAFGTIHPLPPPPLPVAHLTHLKKIINSFSLHEQCLVERVFTFSKEK